MIDSIVQVIIALLIALGLAAIGMYVYSTEKVNLTMANSGPMHMTPIITGVVDLKRTNNDEYNTTDKSAYNYREIMPAVNQLPGAEFTYNFWVWKDTAAFQPVNDLNGDGVERTDSGLTAQDVVLFIKGMNFAQPYNNLCSTKTSAVVKRDVLVKCPLVKFERGTDVLTVEFNTLRSPDVVAANSRNTCSEVSVSWKKMNAHKLSIAGFRDANYDKKWFMVTVIIQDTNPLDPLPLRNKCRCRVFVNGRMELDRYVDDSFYTSASFTKEPSILQQNNGNFYVAPIVKQQIVSNNAATSGTASFDFSTLKIEQMFLGDITYYNFEVDPATLKGLYSSGCTMSSARNDFDITKASLQEKSFDIPPSLDRNARNSLHAF